MYLPHGWASPPFRIDDVTKRSRDPHRLSRRARRKGSCARRHWSKRQVERTNTRPWQRDPTRVRESVRASPCVCFYLIIFPRPERVSTLSHSLSFSRLFSFVRYLAPPLYLFLSLSSRPFLRACICIALSFSLSHRVRRPRVEAFRVATTLHRPDPNGDFTKAREERNHTLQSSTCAALARIGTSAVGYNHRSFLRTAPIIEREVDSRAREDWSKYPKSKISPRGYRNARDQPRKWERGISERADFNGDRSPRESNPSVRSGARVT